MRRGDPPRQIPLRTWLVPFVALLVASLGLFAATAWMEGVLPLWREGPTRWLQRLDPAAALASLANAAEVVAAVLAIAITVVAIVVELAANRYTPRITSLFVESPINRGVMAFFVLTALYCVWVSATLGGSEAGEGEVPRGAVVVALGMITLSLLILLPYFAYVFAFLQPTNIVERIREHALRVVRRAVSGHRQGLRRAMVASLEQLEDVALNAMEHRDRGIGLAATDALARFLDEYETESGDLEDAWFELDRDLARDPSFVAMSPGIQEELTRSRLWVEMKVLRQYHTLYGDALNGMRAVAYLIALNTHRIGSGGLARGRPDVLDLTVRIFNSYLRAGINERDVRTTYYTLYHYRGLAEDALAGDEGERTVRVGRYMRYYGQLAMTTGLPFVLEAVAYDLSLLAEQAFERESPAAETLLDLVLTVDREAEDPTLVQETSLRGVRRAQVRLATFFLARGEKEIARRVWRDMESEQTERLVSIRDELLGEDRPDYWEVTDRGVNFAYLPPERRAWIPEFFSWFGDRLPPPPDLGPAARAAGTGNDLSRTD